MTDAPLILFASLAAAIIVRLYVHLFRFTDRMRKRAAGKNFRVIPFDPSTEIAWTAITTFGFAVIATVPILQVLAFGGLIGHLFQEYVDAKPSQRST